MSVDSPNRWEVHLPLSAEDDFGGVWLCCSKKDCSFTEMISSHQNPTFEQEEDAERAFHAHAARAGVKRLQATAKAGWEERLAQ